METPAEPTRYTPPPTEALAPRLAAAMGWTLHYTEPNEAPSYSWRENDVACGVRSFDPHRFRHHVELCLKALLKEDEGKEERVNAFGEHLDFHLRPSDHGSPYHSMEGFLDRMTAPTEMLARACDYAFWHVANKEMGEGGFDPNPDYVPPKRPARTAPLEAGDIVRVTGPCKYPQAVGKEFTVAYAVGTWPHPTQSGNVPTVMLDKPAGRNCGAYGCGINFPAPVASVERVKGWDE